MWLGEPSVGWLLLHIPSRSPCACLRVLSGPGTPVGWPRPDRYGVYRLLSPLEVREDVDIALQVMTGREKARKLTRSRSKAMLG